MESDPLKKSPVRPQEIPPSERTRIRRRGVSLHTLVTVSRLLATLDFEQILDQVVRSALDLVGAARGFLFLADDDGALSMRVGRTDKGGEIPAAETPDISVSLVQKAVESRRCLYIRDVTEQPSVAKQPSVVRLGIGSVLCLPMVHTDLGVKSPGQERRRASGPHREVIGVIYLDSPEPGKSLSAEDLAVFQALGNLAAAAVTNAAVYQDAIVDGLTRLAHRRHFERTLELEQANPGRRPVSLLMLDLDHFKEVNDSRGHPVGDQVLRLVARILRGRTRPADLVARYGGEEFAVILPACGGAEAMRIAEELCTGVRDVSAREGPVGVTVSIGVATLEEGVLLTKEDLVNRADVALYESKRAGRDRVTAWIEGLSASSGRVDDLRGLFSGEPSRDYRTMRMLLQILLEGSSASEDSDEVLRRMLVRVRDAVSAKRVALYRAQGVEVSRWMSVSAMPQENPSAEDDEVARAATSGGDPGDGRWSGALAREGDVVGVLVVTGPAGCRWPRAEERALLDALCLQLALVVREGQLKEAHRRAAEGERSRLAEENERLADSVRQQGILVGESKAMRALFEDVRRAAPSDASVLIAGETGTGKESLARLLHDLSRRRKGPYVVVDCTSIPKDLVEAELFGHTKGAFTGATEAKSGLLEAAQGGTLFLDEVTELPLSAQAKLLRFLQEGETRRVGMTEPRKLDTRVLAATNRDPENEVREGRLRGDLYYRLRVVTLRVPPLRERGDDVLLLAEHFLERYSRGEGRRLAGFSEAARRALLGHDWPGNVRDLEHRVQRAVLFARGDRIEGEDLELGGAVPGAPRGLRAAVDAMEREAIMRALSETKGNVSQAAERLLLNRSTLQALIKRHGLERDRFERVRDDER